jgi:hypothetical protein
VRARGRKRNGGKNESERSAREKERFNNH